MRFAAPLLLISAGFGSILPAQLIDCDVSPTGYKIFLDDVAPAVSTPAAGDSKVFMNRLRMKLRSNLEVLKVETRLPLTIVRCEGRRPNDENDFRVTLVDALNSRNVLLEVWGSIMPAEGAGTDTLIGFALIPVRFYERGSQDLPGVYTLKYATSSQNPSHLLDLIGEARELKAFVLIAGGTKALKEKHFNEAYACLCDAGLLLGQLQAEGIAAAREALVRYVLRLAAESVRLANGDPAYSGALRLLDAANAAQICAGNR